MVPLSHTYRDKGKIKSILANNRATFTKLFTWVTPWNTWMNQMLGVSVRVLLKGPFKYLNHSFPYPFLCFNLWNPYPFIYLQPEKGTPFGRSLLGSTTPLPRKPGFSIWSLTTNKNTNTPHVMFPIVESYLEYRARSLVLTSNNACTAFWSPLFLAMLSAVSSTPILISLRSRLTWRRSTASTKKLCCCEDRNPQVSIKLPSVFHAFFCADTISGFNSSRDAP